VTLPVNSVYVEVDEKKPGMRAWVRTPYPHAESGCGLRQLKVIPRCNTAILLVGCQGIEMTENGRRVRSQAKANELRKLTRDPIRMIELGLVALGTIVAAVSSFFSWQAASSAAQQAQYAREALTAADANATFRSYITSWNSLCNAITPPEYFLTVGIPSCGQEDRLYVSATNLGFDASTFNLATYVDRVATAEDDAKDKYTELRTFLPEGEYTSIELAIFATGYLYTFSPETIRGRDGLQAQLVRISALCHYYTDEQIKWFKDRSHRTKPVILWLEDMQVDYSMNIQAAPFPR
jgi:hypothetical protein